MRVFIRLNRGLQRQSGIYGGHCGCSKNTSHAKIIQLLYWHHWENVVKWWWLHFRRAWQSSSGQPTACACLVCPNSHAQWTPKEGMSYTDQTDDSAVNFNLNPLRRISSKGKKPQKCACQRHSGTEQQTPWNLENNQDAWCLQQQDKMLHTL